MTDYILSEENVQQLFAYLEDQLDACGCDHTLRSTKNGSRIIFQQRCMKKLLRKSMIWADIVIAKYCSIAMKIMI